MQFLTTLILTVDYITSLGLMTSSHQKFKFLVIFISFISLTQAQDDPPEVLTIT